VCRLPCRICENAVDQNVFHLSTACQFPVERRVYRGDRGKSTGTAVNIPAADAQIDSVLIRDIVLRVKIRIAQATLAGKDEIDRPPAPVGKRYAGSCGG